MKLTAPVATRESGVRWLRRIPAHWGVVQSRRLFSERNEKAREGEQQLTVSQKYGLIAQSEFMEREGRRVVQVLKGYDILKRTQAGDFVMSMRSFQGGLEYSTLSGAISSAYVPLKPLKWVHNDYFRYLFKSEAYIQELQSTSDLVRDGQALRFENFSKVSLPVVPIEEQERIASYLDRTSERIDALIAKKSRFIALLREKREALIAHTVTKGLIGSTPLKPSGVGWLGDIPAHWGVIQSRRVFAERNEKARAGEVQLTVSQKYGLIAQSEFMEREGRRVVQVLKGHDILKHVEAGDFVISMRSFQGGLELSYLSGSMSSAYVALSPVKEIDAGYFRHLFKSSTYIQALQSTSDLVRDGQALRFENFSKVPLPLVPVEEQRAIAAYLDQAIARIDALMLKTERSIGLLREHRTSIITAAVTGKIDLCADREEPA
ncbi:restriction endonuclease subunit S [Ramlibacter sp.]|uniref:restriction endonuclease subunit S n=1 Tax=Ramlibacter sp. TaxID=1917967 RepID=UPI002B7CC5A6|nr:restriction endonuclease subunit S [Ramlibacter sp.]HWI80388.1 restriction endonuclease subunit S [Ramlibacter sp.]